MAKNKCKHPRMARKKHLLGRYLDKRNNKLYKVWLVRCGLCGEGLFNKRKRVRG